MAAPAQLDLSLPAFSPAPYEDRDFWNRVRQSPWAANVCEAAIKAAQAMSGEPRTPSAMDYLAGISRGDLSPCKQAWRSMRTELGLAATRRCLVGHATPELDAALLNRVWALVCLPCWSTSAHLKPQELPDLRREHLDLGSCMTGFVLAECVEVLSGWLQQSSANLLNNVVHALRTRLLTPFATLEGKSRPRWARPSEVHSNWTGVCAGSILGIVCALESLGYRHDQAKQRAFELLDLYLRHGFTESGECDEGPGYWAYGLGTACLGMMRCPAGLLAEQLDLQRLAQVAGYLQRAHLFGDTFYAANDAEPRLTPRPQWMLWLAQLVGDPWLADWAKRPPIADECTVMRGGDTASGWGLMPWRGIVLETLHQNDVGKPIAPRTGPLALPDQQAFSVKSGSILATLAGGHNGERHNHNDVGHVNVWLNQTPVVIDLGKPEYSPGSFNTRRYELLANSSLGHNVPVINGHAQASGRDRAATATGEAAIQAAAVYPAAAGIRLWQRHIEADSDVVMLADRFELDAGTDVKLRFWLPCQPTLDQTAVRLLGMEITFDTDDVLIEATRAQDHQLTHTPHGGLLWCLKLILKADDLGVAIHHTRFREVSSNSPCQNSPETI